VIVKGEISELKNTINTMWIARSFASEGDARGARGRHRGKLGGQADVKASPDVERPDRTT